MKSASFAVLKSLSVCVGLSLMGPAVHATTWSIKSNCTGTPTCVTHPQDIYWWSSMAPGDTVLLYATDTGVPWVSKVAGGAAVNIGPARGTAVQKIVVKGVNGPKVTQGLNIAGAQFVEVSGLDISENRTLPDGSGRAAVTIQAGSTSITLSNNQVHHATGNGVSVSLDAGPRLVIGPGNSIYNNRANGIGIRAAGADPAAAAPGITSYVSANAISGNGVHGVELEAPYWRIDDNTVSGNGVATGGTSGIHLFSRTDKATPDCDNNEILYNHVTGQKDSTQADGNGIHMDHFCDRNTVAFNVVWANAGAGIAITAGKGNVVAVNTVYNNATDQNRAGTPALRGEILLSSYANFCWNGFIDPASCMIPVGRTSGNILFDNLVHSNQKAVPGLHANPDVVDTTRNRNAYYPNLYFNAAGGANLRWGTRDYTSATDIDAVTGLSAQGGGNVVEAPNFLNVATPGPGQDGLRLRTKPSKEGWVIPVSLEDMLGALPPVGGAFFGAYYTKP